MIDFYLLGRVFGMAAFSLMLVQIILATWFKPLIKWHMRVGIITFVLAWLHPTMWVVFWGWQTTLTLGGYAWFGKLGLVLMTAAVGAGLWRAHPLVTKYWRWIHRLNYLVFAMIYIHSWMLGTDANRFPLKAIYYLAPIVLVLALTRKLLELRITANGNR